MDKRSTCLLYRNIASTKVCANNFFSVVQNGSVVVPCHYRAREGKVTIVGYSILPFVALFPHFSKIRLNLTLLSLLPPVLAVRCFTDMVEFILAAATGEPSLEKAAYSIHSAIAQNDPVRAAAVLRNLVKMGSDVCISLLISFI
jgi:hypothetical protein